MRKSKSCSPFFKMAGGGGRFSDKIGISLSYICVRLFISKYVCFKNVLDLVHP